MRQLKFYSVRYLVPDEIPAQRPVAQNFDIFFDLHPNKRLSKIVRLVIWDAIVPIMTST